MKPINSYPIEVDFNNRETDGAVRLHLPVTEASIESLHIVLAEGQMIHMTDGDVEINGKTELREGIWVAQIDENEFKDVDRNAPYFLGHD